jgi:hypothetical protein
MAKEHHAYVLYIEDREYGLSQPFDNTNVSNNNTDENIVYCTTDNALLDFITVIKQFRKKYTNVGKVIAFGGS